MNASESFKKLIIEYRSGPIPPPFCYRYRIEIIKCDENQWKVNLGLEYYDRDELTEEEILDEGFSLQDDYSWYGYLPAVWGQEITNKLKSTSWRKKPIPNADGSEFIIGIGLDKQIEHRQPAELRVWETLAQEIIQVVFELSKKEAPLSIGFLTKNADHETRNVDFEFLFSQRSILITASDEQKKSMEWAEGQNLLKYIFALDYLPEKSFEKIPKKPGNYIFPGDGFWYNLSAQGDRDEYQGERVKKLIRTLSSYL